VITRIRAAYAERSPDGPGHFGAIVKKTMTMVASEPAMTTDDLARITAPVLVLVGDDDAIELSHTCAHDPAVASAAHPTASASTPRTRGDGGVPAALRRRSASGATGWPASRGGRDSEVIAGMAE
jgi:hypothetical protein